MAERGHAAFHPPGGGCPVGAIGWPAVLPRSSLELVWTDSETQTNETGDDMVGDRVAAAGGGALTLISSTNVTSNTANIDFTGLSGYETYFLQISGAVPSVDGPYVVMQIGDSSGFDTAQNEYGWHMLQIRANLGSVENTAKPHTTNDTNSTWISLYRRGLGNATNEGYSGSFWISNKANQFTIKKY